MNENKRIERTEDEWKQELTPEEYAVLRGKGTEVPFSGEIKGGEGQGEFQCRACGNQLFASDSKFESGTGWPSFDDALPGTVDLIQDNSHGMSRTEVVCANCHSHLGHVFDDGPKETTGKRYCINAVCLQRGDAK